MYFRRIRDLRTDSDLPQSRIAAYLGIRQNTYSDYENGKIRNQSEFEEALENVLSGG